MIREALRIIGVLAAGTVTGIAIFWLALWVVERLAP